MPKINPNKVYMKIAYEIAQMSYANRKKVGAILVKDNSILCYGYNGTVSGFDNNCEIDNVTVPEVIHAEGNCIAKVAKSTSSCEGAVLYVTLSPCYECSKLIIQSGISKVYFHEFYRNINGIDFLNKMNVPCIHLEDVY